MIHNSQYLRIASALDACVDGIGQGRRRGGGGGAVPVQRAYSARSSSLQFRGATRPDTYFISHIPFPYTQVLPNTQSNDWTMTHKTCGTLNECYFSDLRGHSGHQTGSEANIGHAHGLAFDNLKNIKKTCACRLEKFRISWWPLIPLRPPSSLRGQI